MSLAVHDFNGEDYRKASTHQKEWGQRLIGELGLRGYEKVLDLGCGDGVLTAQIAALVPEGVVVGIDSSPGMIETARQMTAPNITFVQMDIGDLAYQAEFDVIFSNATLHWVHDHRSLLDACHLALVTGGSIRFNFAGEGNCANLNRVLKHRMEEDRFCRYFDGFQWPWYMPALEEYVDLARRSGFSGIDVWGENLDRFFADRVEMTRWIDQPSLVPFVARIDESDKKHFRDAVVSDMVKGCEQPDGRCFEQFRRINVRAEK